LALGLLHYAFQLRGYLLLMYLVIEPCAHILLLGLLHDNAPVFSPFLQCGAIALPGCLRAEGATLHGIRGSMIVCFKHSVPGFHARWALPGADLHQWRAT
jgi:hypothetical protein